ncbi:hypothetical protein JJD41_23540 [Oxynema sp. CENA135]|nr:hypothetical protein [Oxynema sp. CENA135]MBK4732817.1 hypothetical protein [Oxynema sp. CENA135]
MLSRKIPPCRRDRGGVELVASTRSRHRFFNRKAAIARFFSSMPRFSIE